MTERGPDGKFLPGNQAGIKSKGGGRPTSEAAERLRVTLEEIVSNGTLPKWKAAIKRKLEKGDPWATEFVFERLMGKVPTESKVELSGPENGPIRIVAVDYHEAISVLEPDPNDH